MFCKFLESGEEDKMREEAVKIALEREEAGPFFKALQAVKMFCKSNPELVMVDSDSIGLSTVYTVYSPNPFRHALAISNDIARNVAGPELNEQTSNGTFVALGAPDESFWVAMRTELTHQRFVVSYRLRTICKIVRGQSCTKYAVRDVGCSVPPPEFELAKVNYMLFSPEFESQWPELLERERELTGKFSCREAQMTVGGKQKPPCKTDTRDIVFRILTEKEIPNLAFAGYWASQKLSGRQHVHSSQVVPMILAESPETVRSILQKRLGTAVECRKRNLEIPGFTRLERHGLYVVRKGGYPCIIAEVLNIPAYDVVPMSSFVNVAHARVVMFVVFLEAWIRETLCRPTDPVSRAIPFCAWARTISSSIKKSGRLGDPYDKWVGSYEPESTWFKDHMLAGKRHAQYFPAVWKAKNGNYRTS